MSWTHLPHDLLDCHVCGQPARYRYTTEREIRYASAIPIVLYWHILRCPDHAPSQRKKP